MTYTLKAFASDTLAAELAAGATSATLTTGAFGTMSGEQLLVVDYDVPAKREIIKVTIGGTSLTSLTRGVDGTSDVTHAAGAKVIMSLVPSHYDSKANVTQESWTNVTYQNNWVDSGTSNYGVGYMKDSMGFVHLRGTCKSGTAQSVIFTLSAGYRPTKAMFVSGVANDLWAGIQIAANGQVSCFTNTNVYVDLDGITFKAEQ